MPPLARKLDLRKTLFLLPNIITLSSVFCGFDSIRISATAQGDDDYYRASLLLVFALFFDMLDGRVARLTKTQSAFGLQIDSLADAISFGVAPALLVYKWSLWQRPTAGLIAGFLFAGAGAVRLARFNVLSMGEKRRAHQAGQVHRGPAGAGRGGHPHLAGARQPRHGRRAAPARGRAYVWAMIGADGLPELPHGVDHQVPAASRTCGSTRARCRRGLRGRVAAIVSLQTRPAFVLVWLLSFYVVIGLVESIVTIPRRRREEQAAVSRRSIPPQA